jgi:hypothetical protein
MDQERIVSQVQPVQPAQRNPAPGRTGDAPDLRSMLSMDEVLRRPSRPPNYAAENQALIAPAQDMAASPEAILQNLADTALTLCRAHSAGLSLLEDAGPKEQFSLARYRWTVGASRKRRNTAQLRPVRHGPGPRCSNGTLASRTGDRAFGAFGTTVTVTPP